MLLLRSPKRTLLYLRGIAIISAARRRLMRLRRLKKFSTFVMCGDARGLVGAERDVNFTVGSKLLSQLSDILQLSVLGLDGDKVLINTVSESAGVGSYSPSQFSSTV